MVAQTPNMDISLSNLDSHSLNSASFFFHFIDNTQLSFHNHLRNSQITNIIL